VVEAGVARVNVADQAARLDQVAFGDLYRRLARPLWGYLRRVTGDASLADDLLQEAFTRLLAQPEPPLDEAAQRAWLYRTASRLAVDAHRRSTRERPDTSAVDDVAAEGHAGRDPFLQKEMTSTFGQLSPRERALLWLAYVEDSSHRDIAGSLGVKEASVRVLLFRARKKLATLWSQRRLGRS
jgi:RNA polymerase sigma-70 factor (ECF subfamily)